MVTDYATTQPNWLTALAVCVMASGLFLTIGAAAIAGARDWVRMQRRQRAAREQAREARSKWQHYKRQMHI